MTAKRSGEACPSCRASAPAEYAMKGQPPQWKCSCGAGGELFGAFAGRDTAKAAPAPAVKKHWKS